MMPGLLFFFLIAIVDWLAVARGWKKVEYAAKPAAMLVLLGLLVLVGGLGSPSLICFAAGLLFSLFGDVFLLFPEGGFLPGLGAFLLAQVAYIVGLNLPLSGIPWLAGLGVVLLLAVIAGLLLRRILQGVRAGKEPYLAVPVAVYGTVLTLMLFSALLSIFRSDWKVSAAGLAAVGAALFYASDILLAWNKFIVPLRYGRVLNMITYHLGQAALVVACILQFG